MKTIMKQVLGACLLASMAGCQSLSVTPSGNAETKTWQEELREQLPMLGHRNWILVVDKAFPLQTTAGMEYIHVDESLLPALTQVLELVSQANHIKPILFRDQELSYITQAQAPGIDGFRKQLNKIIEGRPVQTLAHDSVFRQLDEASRLFKILVIKTNETLPYSSIFLQLDCDYWDADREKQLRNSME